MEERVCEPPAGALYYVSKLARQRVCVVVSGEGGDEAGNLWIATGRGLSKLDRDRKTFHNYGPSDGLPLAEYYRAHYKTRSGELLIGSAQGLIAFDPAAVQGDISVPPVVFTGFLLANKPVPMFPYPGSPGYSRRWGAPDDRAWERAMDFYLAQFDEFSDIQDARPRPLAELELQDVNVR